jgi:hypothetical protein
MLSRPRRKLKGQTMALVGLLVGFGVLLGFVALATDGGSALVQRRNMQNGANSTALGLAKVLAQNIVINQGEPGYIITNREVVTQARQLLERNRGGTTGTPTYSSTIEYGSYINGSYVYTVAATCDNCSVTWSHNPAYPADRFVANNVDAVRVTAGVNNPTNFARLPPFNVRSVAVFAKAAAALNNVEGYQPQGPTWPMTRCEKEEYTTEYGICNPEVFWSSNGAEDCTAPGNFTNLLHLGAGQGSSSEGEHLQLITAHDERDPMVDYTVTGMNTHCSNPNPAGRWYPGGGCANIYVGPDYGNGHGDVCCTNANVAQIDVLNYLRWNFTGRISLTSTQWLDPSGDPHPEWNVPGEQGDWLEVINSGNFGQNIQLAIYDTIRDPQNRQIDALYPYYGYHVKKVMYLYDANDGQVWFTPPPGCTINCTPRWEPARSNEAPERVHMTQSVIFRFYERLATQGQVPRPGFCQDNTNIGISGSEVLGIYGGDEILEPPPNPGGGHGQFNYVGFIDP